MKKAGKEVTDTFNSLGLDPALTTAEKIARAEEIRLGAKLTDGEMFKANAYHVIKSGNSSDAFHYLLKFRLGQESFFTKEEAIQAAQGECDEHGIDPTLPPQERITRLIDIKHGSPHTQVEKDLMNKIQSTLKD